MKAGESKIDVPELSRASPELIVQPADLDLPAGLLFPDTDEHSPKKVLDGRYVQDKDKNEQTTYDPDNLSENLP